MINALNDSIRRTVLLPIASWAGL